MKYIYVPYSEIAAYHDKNVPAALDSRTKEYEERLGGAEVAKELVDSFEKKKKSAQRQHDSAVEQLITQYNTCLGLLKGKFDAGLKELINDNKIDIGESFLLPP